MSDGNGSAETRRALRQLIVHDLRSPLAVVLGQCDLLAMRGNLNPADAASVEAIARAARTVLELVDRAGDMLPKTEGATPSSRN
ncbi:MAG: hypothetical protein KC656_07885 [Myxococcales bacterium]|nr:hypothetical protein [Myxococcales bacterium]